MSQEVQFLIISHNKIIIEIADCLIGVTMQEPGVFPHHISQYARSDSNGGQHKGKMYVDSIAIFDFIIFSGLIFLYTRQQSQQAMCPRQSHQKSLIRIYFSHDELAINKKNMLGPLKNATA